MSDPTTPRKKFNYVGPPACFIIEEECRKLNEAFNGFGIYQVGSSLERPDFRDVDLRMILSDEEFEMLFPDASLDGSWEHDARWLYMVIAISERLSRATGLRIDFQFQPQTFANAKHPGNRHARGMRYSKRQAA